MPGPTPRTVRVERLMGTVVTVDVRDGTSPAIDRAIDLLLADLRDVERRFSPWLPDSEISRIADGRLSERDASPDVRFALSVCDHLAAVTDGAFDARRHRADGRLDPSGFVKGWAVEEAASRLVDAGLLDYAVNAGGDILVRGDAEPGGGHGWRVGIRDPEDPSLVVRVLRVRGLAVATSGLYERGAHIRDPRSPAKVAAPGSAGPAADMGPEEPRLSSLTVVGPSLGWADAYATAGFAMGDEALPWIETRPGYGALAVTADRNLAWTARLDPLLAAPADAVDPAAADPGFSRSSQPAALELVP
jgi:thiamine biosynthesis lipoprotein